MNLHPIFAEALRPFAPPPAADQAARTAALREKLWDEYDTGLDDVDGRYSREEGSDE